jgi:hypothetical protein
MVMQSAVPSQMNPVVALQIPCCGVHELWLEDAADNTDDIVRISSEANGLLSQSG